MDQMYQQTIPEFLTGGGEMGQRIRDFDWSNTELGPVDTWPQSLRTCIRIMLTSRQPIWIGWGKDLIKLYNDPYRAIVGGKHPWALGQPARIVWKDIWKDIEPMLKQVMEKDEGTYVEAQLLIMERNGYPEETYYTFSYTPIPGDLGGTAGMICANTDDTDRIISERQLKTLTQLAKNLTDCKTDRQVIENAVRTMATNPHDFPFVLYREILNNKATLVHSTSLGEAKHIVPTVIDLDADVSIAPVLREAKKTRKLQVFENLVQRVGELPGGAWNKVPDKAIVLPITQNISQEPYGYFVVGLNPYRLADEKYLDFFSLVADQVATSFASVHALEAEKKRTKALAEIDRAKTTFFSNISHEFRTPLTLLLGPIEEILDDPRTHPDNKIRIEMAYRNVLRLQKLVNTLLDFSKIEAGRVEGQYTKVDICALTKDLASTFRAAIEKAGMELRFELCSVQDDVYVDIDMWEKIILNLVSNAFKYSKAGCITLGVEEKNKTLYVSVTDDGVGIEPEQQEKIFERFHRVENSQGRSQEGTGIGLSMVKELVKIHGGDISVRSKPGKGSTFIVSIPTGLHHLPTDKILLQTDHHNNGTQTTFYQQEAMKWLDNGTRHTRFTGINPDKPTECTILLADDNADMREYVHRLLSGHYKVITAIDGVEAFEILQHTKPDLLVSDIMMPRLDGIGLLHKLRSHPDLKNIPVIFLSARAGEEAKIEGLEAGADDYLVKPFTAKELLARVDANIRIAKSRLMAENNLRRIIMQSPVAMNIMKGENLVIEMVNDKNLEIWGKTYDEVINKSALDIFPELAEPELVASLLEVMKTGQSFTANERPFVITRNGKSDTVYLNFITEPLRNNEGLIDGILSVAIEVTEQVQAREKIEHSQKEMTLLANAMPQLVWVADRNGNVWYYNDRVNEFKGAQHLADGKWHWQGMVHPDDVNETTRVWRHAVETGTIYQTEHRIQMKDGHYRWFLSRGIPQKDPTGKVISWFGTATDIHISKQYEQTLEEEVLKRTSELNEMNVSLQQSNSELLQFAHVASHDLKEPLRKIKTFTSRIKDDKDSRLSEKAAHYMQKVHSATNRMYAMIEGVLEYSMINATEQATELINLDKVVNNIQSDLELLISQKKAILTYDHLPEIEGPMFLVYQLFYNLIYNALKFSKADVPSHIQIRSAMLNQNDVAYAVISIEDNGIGFEQEQAENIFHLFARLHSRESYDGTGLGLSLCKRIVQKLGGSISATGRKNEGAVFEVHLPVKQ